MIKTICYSHKKFKDLRQASNYGLILKKGLRVIKFNQNSCLKSCIDMNAELSKKWFQKRFFQTYK